MGGKYDLHNVSINRKQVEDTRVKLKLPQPVHVQGAKFQLLDSNGNPIGDLLGGLSDDAVAVANWLANLAGSFCDAYNQGGTVGGQKVSIKEVLQKVADILSATGTADGKAAAAAITLVISTLDAAC